MARPSVEAERREQILAATREVVAEMGFRAMRVADVAKRSGASTGTVHYYFETKRELMQAAFEWNFHASQARRTPVVEAHEDPRDRLRAFLDSYLPVDEVVVQSWHMWIELWTAALHDTDLRELNENVYGEWRRTVAGIIRDGQDRGYFVTGDPVLLANGLVSMVDGLALQVLLGSRSMTLEQMRRVCEQSVELILTEGS
ncbi:HTH-type transcriptional regulator BetI [Nocardioides dokdonensis FR1436]|uniref:HTH-type transcriptional regulator BetI n=1 Tax=Nocardioides dokdonensis FR1436 TaxID=1300347 RepID=A0A1A9GKR8_9ACTN|nr:TetR/AcrR family transcriptional regulator [Nocardioides dokdonensis]ANH38252.1 HTH-type transcriptional regulator BetI [Nocardioides dokdonensis FR1436]